MRQQISSHQRAVCIHEAAYKLAAEMLAIELEPTSLRHGLRRHVNDLITGTYAEYSADGLEALALMMLVAGQALHQLAPDVKSTDRDDCGALDLVAIAFWKRNGPGALKIPSVRREFKIKVAQLQSEAQKLLADPHNIAEITKLADELAANHRR
jgi:hypothetical protein